MAKYKLKASCYPFGPQCGPIDNDNLTDEIAEHLIESGRLTKEDFVIEKEKSQGK